MTSAALRHIEAEATMAQHMQALTSRFHDAQREMANDLGRLTNQIEAHPRHNEKSPELDRLLQIHDTLAECMKKLADRIK